MNLKYCIIASLLCISLLFQGCNNRESNKDIGKTDSNPTMKVDVNPFIPETEEVEYALGYGVVGFDDESFMIEYNGEPIELEYRINNYESEAEVGVFLFVDGLLQRVKGLDGQLTDMTLIKAPKEQNVTQKVSFIPAFGVKNENYNVRVAYVLNPNTYADSEQFVFGHNTRASSHFPFKLKVNNNIESKIQNQYIGETEELTESERNELVYTDKSGRDINKLRECQFEDLTKNNGYGYLEFADDKITLDCEIYGGADESYYISAIVNNVIIKNCGAVSVKSGFYKTTMSIDITTSMLEESEVELNEYNNLYLFVVPVSDKTESSLIKSETYIFKNTEVG